MRGLRADWAFAAALFMLALPAASVVAQSRSPFDGTWVVVLTCTAAHDGAAGYTFRFPATVQNGILHGENGVRGQAGSMFLDGSIAADGQAMLVAQGLTNNPVYSVGRVPPAMPYTYHLQSTFQPTRGTGKRIELRPCEAVFSRQ